MMRTFRTLLVGMAGIFVMLHASPVLYHGGEILTMEGDKPHYAESIVTDKGKIVFVGSLSNAQKSTKTQPGKI